MLVSDSEDFSRKLSSKWNRLAGISVTGPLNPDLVGKLFAEAGLPKIRDLMDFYAKYPCMETTLSQGDQSGFRLWDLEYMADNYKIFRGKNSESDLVPFADVDEHSFFFYFKVQSDGHADVFTDLDDFNTPVANTPSEFIAQYLNGNLNGL